MDPSELSATSKLSPLLIETNESKKKKVGLGSVEAGMATHPRSFTASSLGTATNVSVLR